jgi:hypothetical protein
MYPIGLDVHYETDNQYRECLESVFGEDLCYFNERVAEIQTKTAGEDAFQELYRLSACQILTENIVAGITILFSYSYFSLFHALLTNFLSTETDGGTIVLPLYNELKRLLEIQIR